MEGKFYVGYVLSLLAYVHSLFAYSLIPKLLGIEASLYIIKVRVLMLAEKDNFSAER